MKLTKTASGKSIIKLSKSEWEDMGKKAGWLKVADISTEQVLERFPHLVDNPFLSYINYCIDIEDLIIMAKKTESKDLGDNEIGINRMHISLCQKCKDRLERVKIKLEADGYVPSSFV
jgi:hypothetical protein